MKVEIRTDSAICSLIQKYLPIIRMPGYLGDTVGIHLKKKKALVRQP